jgi:RHS repeat-associated protein
VYDAENRITNVLTSADSINWDNDAFYQYYDHGPLARTVLGEQQVQGINHAYNLQGWIKSFNPDINNGNGYTLKADGSAGSIVGKPAYQISLNYFDGDYKAISGATPWNGATALGGNYRPLYNGNISNMAVSIEALNNPLLYNYQYDQLNRLVSMDAWKKNSSWSALTPSNDYQERVSYDPNGNILSYKRNGTTLGGRQLEMDDLIYNYITGTNRVDHVGDNVSATNYTEDIDAQSAGNYDYNAIGELVKDNAEDISKVRWTGYGKIKQIEKNDGTTILYTYDPSGNRNSKTVNYTSPASSVTTWYVRDVQGNVMSVYEAGKTSVNDGRLTQTELHLYGSKRIGILRRSFDVKHFVSTGSAMQLLGTVDSISFDRGNRLFELSNHLGNVLVTVNDKKKGVSSNNSTVDYFNPQVMSAQDYYPFGMLQPGRSNNASGYRFGFNGKENDNEVKGEGEQQDYGMRFYDPRLGRFLSVDPLSKSFPWYTPYQFAGNKPIIAVDLDGEEEKVVINHFENEKLKVTVTYDYRDVYVAGTLRNLPKDLEGVKRGEGILTINRFHYTNPITPNYTEYEYTPQGADNWTSGARVYNNSAVNWMVNMGDKAVHAADRAKQGGVFWDNTTTTSGYIAVSQPKGEIKVTASTKVFTTTENTGALQANFNLSASAGGSIGVSNKDNIAPGILGGKVSNENFGGIYFSGSTKAPKTGDFKVESVKTLNLFGLKGQYSESGENWELKLGYSTDHKFDFKTEKRAKITLVGATTDKIQFRQ